MRAKGCLKRRLIALAIVTTLSSGCAREASDHSACPPVVAYPEEVQQHAAREIEALSPGAVIESMLADYHVLRRQAQACRVPGTRITLGSGFITRR